MRLATRLASTTLKRGQLLRRSVFVVLQPERLNRAAYSDDGSFRCVMLAAGQMRAAAAQVPRELPTEFLDSAEASGDRCLAIFDGETLASFGWYAPREARLFDRRLAFDPSCVYMYHGFTAPAYRGKRLHALGLARALEHFVDEGRRALVSTVNDTNHASLASVERLGFERCGHILQLGGGIASVRIVTPAARAYGVRFVRERQR